MIASINAPSMKQAGGGGGGGGGYRQEEKGSTPVMNKPDATGTHHEAACRRIMLDHTRAQLSDSSLPVNGGKDQDADGCDRRSNTVQYV